MTYQQSTPSARGGAGLDEHALNRPDAWWQGYAAGHADGTAEAQLLITVAQLAAHALRQVDDAVAARARDAGAAAG